MEKQTPNQDNQGGQATAKTEKKQSDNAFLAFFKKVADTCHKKWESFIETSFGQKFHAHFQKHGYLYFSFFVPVLVFFMVFILQGTYPFGRGSVLVLDLNGQYVYFFEALRKAIYGDASLLYSWSGTLGAEFIGIYAYYLASPLSYLVALFPEGAMTEFLLVLELLKCGLCGLTMAYYLRKTRPMANEMITISIAIMYALSAFAIVMAHNTMWIDALILLPLIVYGIEGLINYGKFKLFIISLALALFANFYIGYMLCFFVAIYFFYYYFFASHRKSSDYATVKDGTNNFIGESNHFAKSFLRMCAASVIALLIACAIILPTYYSLSMGKTTFSTTNWDFVLFETAESKNLFFKFNPIDFISKLFIGSYDSVRRSGFPFVYCGMFALILVPVYFLSKRVNLRQKIGAGLILFTLFAMMIISPIDLVMHGFQAPNWLNYRYSFLFSFMMLVFSHRALELLHTVKVKKTLIVSIVWAALVLICSLFTKNGIFVEADDTSEYIRREIIFIIVPIVCLAAYEVGHHLLNKERLRAIGRASVISTLAVVICLEMFIGTLLNTTSLNDDVTFSPKFTKPDGTWLEGYDNYLDKYRPVVYAIQASDPSFYRMEKEGKNLRKYGDNYAFGMRGTTGSTSTLNAKTIKFLNRLGYISQSNISSNKGATSVSNSLLGIKYYITSSVKHPDNYYLLPYEVLFDEDGNPTYEYEHAEGKYLYGYVNPYALSLAFAANEDLKEYNITKNTSPFVTMNALITALLGEEKAVEVFKELPYEYFYNASTTKYSGQSYKETVYDANGEKAIKYDENGKIVYDSKNQPYQYVNTPYHTFTDIKDDDTASVITFTFAMPGDPTVVDSDTEVFFKIPTNYTRRCSWSFKKNNETSTLSGTCFDDDDKTNCILSLGTMGAGDVGTLTITMQNKEKKPTETLYIDATQGMFYYVDEDLYRDVMLELGKGNFIIEEYTESYFKGTITADKNSTSVFTSIPYDTNWEVTVDGKAVEIYKTCDALVGFDLGSEGIHEVEIAYRSKPLKYGAILSGIGLVLFVGWIVLDTLYFRKKRLGSESLDYTVLSEGDYQSDAYDEELAEEAQKKARRTQYKKKKK